MSVTKVFKNSFRNGKHVKTFIHFDYYLPNQKRIRVKTDYYLLTGKSKAIERINKEMDLKIDKALESANEILKDTQSVIIATQKARQDKEKKITLLNYIQSLIRKHGKQSLYQNLHNNLKKYLDKRKRQDMQFSDIDFKFLEHYRDFMINECKLSLNSARAYIQRLNATCNKAVFDEIISFNPLDKKIKHLNINPKQKAYDYLTVSELATIKAIEINSNNEYLSTIKRAFLFACFTGLRCKQVYELKWSDIKEGSLAKSDVKTDKYNNAKLHPVSLKMLGNPENIQDINGKVFEGLGSQKNMNRQLSKLLKPLNLNKKITFHSARRTFATILHYSGVDLFTIQKLLNHSNIKTTELYTSLLDETKNHAIDKLPNLA